MLASAGRHHEHMQVQPFSEKGRTASRQHQLDNEQLPVSGHRLAASIENGGASLVIPIVQDLREDVHVSTRRERAGEEVAPDARATVRHSCRLQDRFGTCGHVRQIEQDAARGGVAGKDLGQEHATTSGHIHNGPGAGEIVRVGDRTGELTGPGCHRVIENTRRLGILRKYSKMPMPKQWSNAGAPVWTL